MFFMFIYDLITLFFRNTKLANFSFSNISYSIHALVSNFLQIFPKYLCFGFYNDGFYV